MPLSNQTMTYIRLGLQMVVILGGIVGIWLFYPPLSDSFYTYLTNHGFQDSQFQEYLQGIPNSDCSDG
ncbi:hypothetical protein [Listeria fleischmannii]|uniref:Uncharacterized protein n=1 Tax=Listeria fleischmannii FSL S10-1203 TaxID=1265822 RepID=W7DAX0_9LIST|nr:hypothetical protein [Listeria fleischmannii]EUJ44691.1 hypothetical protein MCOL2_19726 [Listeria fleischmannii FSL S10-1203]